jgi:MFS family permease
MVGQGRQDSQQLRYISLRRRGDRIAAGLAGASLTITGIVAAVAAPLTPALIGRVDRRTMTAAFLALLALGNLLSAVASAMVLAPLPVVERSSLRGLFGPVRHCGIATGYAVTALAGWAVVLLGRLEAGRARS